MKNKKIIFLCCFIISFFNFISFCNAGLDDDKKNILFDAGYIEEDASTPVLESLYKQGIENYKANQFDQASYYFKKAAGIDKNYKSAEFLAEALERMQKYPASEAKEKVIGEYYDLGKDYYDQGQYLKAVTTWERVLILEPKNASIINDSIYEARTNIAGPHYEKGWQYYNDERFDKAAEEWEQVLALDPSYKGLSDLLAKTKVKLKQNKVYSLVQDADSAYKRDDLNKALDLVSQALKQEPNNESALELKREIFLRSDKLYDSYFSKGMDFYKAQSFSDSLDNFSKAFDYATTSAKKSEARTYINKSKSKIAGKSKQEKTTASASGEQDQGVRVAPLEEQPKKAVDEEEVRSHYNKGLYYYKNGYLDKAIAEWEIVINLDPENERAYTSLQKAKAELAKTKK
jgi:tetratricopeptide (TPR) repeat protein